MATKQNSFYQTESWIKGHNGEQLIADLLRERGWYVIPSYDYTGEDDKAPRLQGLKESLVIPDLDIARNGKRQWAEVKTKEKADFTVITQRLEHGIPLRHYHHYFRVQEITGDEVWLIIYETSTGDVLLGKLDDLSKLMRPYEGNKMNPGGMAFFPRDAFKLWMNIHQMELSL